MQPHNYKGWTLAFLLIGYLAALIMAAVDASILNGTSGVGVIGVSGAFLLIALHLFVIIKDGRSFFTLFGKIQWQRMNGLLRIGLGFIYLCGWIMFAAYLVMAIRNFLRRSRQTLGQALHSGWSGYRRRNKIAQIGLAVACAVLVGSFALCTAAGASTDRLMVLGLLPTAAPEQPTPVPTTIPTHAVALVATTTIAAPTAIDTPTSAPTSTPTATPSPTPTMIPTATPTPKPVATQPRPTPTPTHCVGVNNNPWCYDFNPGNLIYSPPSAFCSYFTCVSTFWTAIRGYVTECQNGSYTHSGGVTGACSRDGGVWRALYSH